MKFNSSFVDELYVHTYVHFYYYFFYPSFSDMYIPTIHNSIILYYLLVVDDCLIFPVVVYRCIKETVVDIILYTCTYLSHAWTHTGSIDLL